MSNERTWKLMNLLWPLVVLFVLANLIYTVFTGESIGTDVQYNTVGRILSGLGAVAFLIFCIWSFRANRRLDKQLAERRNRGSD